MGFFSDFKASLMKGDVLSLATAVVIGAAFGKIVTSVVEDVIMPIIGLITGGIDFSQKFISLTGESYATLEAAKAADAAVITYGNLVQAMINFIIIAFFVFIVLRAKNAQKRSSSASGCTWSNNRREVVNGNSRCYQKQNVIFKF